MTNLLKLTDEDFATAAEAISTALDDRVSLSKTNTILRMYVDLGAGKTWATDYPNSNSSDADTIVNAISEKLSNTFSSYTKTEVYAVLNSVAAMGGTGTIDLRIAFPLRYELQQEAAQQVSHSTTQPGSAADTSIAGAFERTFRSLFGTAGKAIGDGIRSAANAAGVDPELFFIATIVIVVGIVAFLIFRLVKK